MRRREDGTEVKVEITTYRSDTYDPESRKPEVSYGDSLEGDLSRRDFTVNAMALRVPQLEFVDPFGGASDLAKGVLRHAGGSVSVLRRRPAAHDACRAFRRTRSGSASPPTRLPPSAT